jgi:predicted alpha/beta-hydrolase family hydrolase
MITFILPGYSPSNRDWADEVAKNLKLDGQIRPIYWDHWEDESQTFKPKEKKDLIVRHAKGDSFNIIAKSVGTLVAALIANEVPSQVKKIILCGIPTVSDERLKIFQEAFTGFPPEKIIVFQNEKDPFATDEEVKSFMMKVNPKIKVISKERKDHHYPYFDEFQKFLEE